MKTILLVLILGLAAAGFSACSSPDNRIKSHQSAFDNLSPQDQGKIRGGQVEVGFTEEMVVMALGEPDRRYSRTTAEGTTDVWAYRDRAPRISLGLGIGGGGGSTGVGAGVGLSTGGDRSDDRLRIVFAQGRVSAIERRGKN